MAHWYIADVEDASPAIKGFFITAIGYITFCSGESMGYGPLYRFIRAYLPEVYIADRIIFPTAMRRFCRVCSETAFHLNGYF